VVVFGFCSAVGERYRQDLRRDNTRIRRYWVHGLKNLCVAYL